MDNVVLPRWINRTNITINILLVIIATAYIGAALPAGHRYEGGWIFGLAWFPIVLFAAIEIVSASQLPQKTLNSIATFLFPYAFVVISIVLGNDVSVRAFIVQSAMVQFTASMLAFALQASVFPLYFKQMKHVSEFLQAEAFPQLFGAGLGIVLSYFAFSFLLSERIIALSDLPILFLGIISSAFTLSLVLHHSRY